MGVSAPPRSKLPATQPSSTRAPAVAILQRTPPYTHLVVLLIPVVLVALPFWPGHMNADTFTQIEEAITGHLTNFHATILIAMWHVVWGTGIGPGWILTGQVITFEAGAYLVMRIAFNGLGAAIAAAARSR